MSVDYTAQITALEAAAASGELRIEADGSMVIYRSMEELLKALAYFRAQQAAAVSPLASRPATTLAQYCAD